MNRRKTTEGRFKCRGTGEQHSGGNKIRYYTPGDDNAKWGRVPAVDPSTPSTFYEDARAYGLASQMTPITPITRSAGLPM